MGHVQVVNQKHTRRLGGRGFATFYVGRPSPLGNPYRIGPDGTREQVISKYRVWLAERLAAKDNPEALGLLAQIVAKVRAGYNVSLACWCAPLPCHADVISDVVVQLAAQDGGA